MVEGVVLVVALLTASGSIRVEYSPHDTKHDPTISIA